MKSTASNGFVPIVEVNTTGNPAGEGAIANMPRVDFWSVDNAQADVY